MADTSPRLPDYAGPCISNVVPTLLEAPDVVAGLVPRRGR